MHTSHVIKQKLYYKEYLHIFTVRDRGLKKKLTKFKIKKTACIHYQKEEGNGVKQQRQGRVGEQEEGRRGEHKKKGKEESRS